MTDTRTLLANRYRLRERIAVGGIVEVWRASDLTLGRTVAVRLLRVGGDVHVQRFLSAAARVARVRHPGIVRVYDYSAEDLFHVTELVNTSSLAAVMGAGPLDPAWVLDLIRQVAAALEAAHSVDLVHQDIRPWNLLLAPGGTVQLADFGLSGAVVFPEPQVPATPATDLYSLGVVAWECLTGALPSTAPRPPSLPPLPTVVPDGVADLVAELTAEDPRARPDSAAEIAHRSRELLAVPMRKPAGLVPARLTSGARAASRGVASFRGSRGVASFRGSRGAASSGGPRGAAGTYPEYRSSAWVWCDGARSSTGQSMHKRHAARCGMGVRFWC